MSRLLRPLVLGLGAITFALPVNARAQQSTLAVSVVDEAGQPMPLAVITADSVSRFTSDKGVLTLSVARWPYRLVVKRIGFVPIDTTIATPTTAVRLAMRRLVIALPTVKVSSGDCKGRSVAADEGLRVLFERVTENAERYRLLARQYPFALTLERRLGSRRADWRMEGRAVDTIIVNSRTRSQYSPGKVLAHDVTPGSQGFVAIPDLTDLADSVFMKSHCFRFVGQAKIDSTSVVRMDFEPAVGLKDPDVEGELYLRAKDYQLVRLVFRLSQIPARLHDLEELSVTTDFREIAPGLSVIGHVDSRLRWASATQTSASGGFVKLPRTGEIQELLLFSWLGNRP